MHCMTKDMKSRALVGNCSSEKFWCWWSSGLYSDSTALNCYVRGSIHGIRIRLHIVAVVQWWSGDQVCVHGGIAGEVGCMEILEGEGSTCENKIRSHIKWSFEFKCTKCMWHKLLNDGRWRRQHMITIWDRISVTIWTFSTIETSLSCLQSYIASVHGRSSVNFLTFDQLTSAAFDSRSVLLKMHLLFLLSEYIQYVSDSEQFTGMIHRQWCQKRLIAKNGDFLERTAKYQQ